MARAAISADCPDDPDCPEDPDCPAGVEPPGEVFAASGPAVGEIDAAGLDVPVDAGCDAAAAAGVAP